MFKDPNIIIEYFNAMEYIERLKETACNEMQRYIYRMKENKYYDLVSKTFIKPKYLGYFIEDGTLGEPGFVKAITYNTYNNNTWPFTIDSIKFQKLSYLDWKPEYGTTSEYYHREGVVGLDDIFEVSDKPICFEFPMYQFISLYNRDFGVTKPSLIVEPGASVLVGLYTFEEK